MEKHEILKEIIISALKQCRCDGKAIDLKNNHGFLVYSTETIDNSDNSDLKKLYEDCCQDINNKKEKNIFRYFYYEKLPNNEPLHATVIMMNPAFADSEKPDDTIKNIKKYLNNENNKFGSFDIINLYPIRMPKSKKLNEFLKSTKSETEKYQKFVKSYLKENCKDHVIIAAWGNNKEDNKLANNLFKDLNIKFYCYGLTKEGYPKHFSSLAYNNFNKFRYPFPYIEINNWLKNKETFTDYDKARLEDVQNLKLWLNSTPHISKNFVEYTCKKLEKIFNEV